ncbi:MAG: magnesium and cobalt transport protein CorA [Polaribacter sp.]|jgi:magnesium transporter|uniref:magnesium and cobalt transport protein CorA n=1 Tax=Polaribacter sp. TaxID=1920175 RepID=UPI0026023198|nr:magnesium and cobalt transport protein CorA [Polaribacter sp.]MBT3741391.1 magnesium and cobalt transport protein CorA [Polaribacter sp.]MBT4414588.1 magnesium and cobalt transport protein CorA [Polaribacter sp.]MBT7815511.1 magnesium and cobalt transport protein CorA [Polaribacter sp.]MDG1196211.1 magnesium and cobalt transport protein CorA [Polaribacter sp.]MDG1402671.1 magnesium and cobalt transport protein CorA [Polaribacter sp.]
MENEFLDNTSLISYSNNIYEKTDFTAISEIKLTENKGVIKWVNTYGIHYQEAYKKVIYQNKLDDFLIKLLSDEEHPNKVILLDDLLFVTTRVLITESQKSDSEQMIFIVSSDFLWSIQEKSGDYFNWIRERLEGNKGIVRKKKADYLLFLLLESIVDNYQDTYEENAELSADKLNSTHIKPTPEFTSLVEKRKQELFNFKKATLSLRDTITKLEKMEIDGFEVKYFSELKEQTTNLISNIDFELQELESKINLIFSIQGHRLNEVMKTLTILSVIFIPLTFLAGIYGMNFENIPELKFKYSYFILLAAMVIITLISVWYFKRKKWF